MILHWKAIRALCLPFLLSMLAASIVLSTPTPESRSRSITTFSNRQPKTVNMTMGMNMLKDMLQNGMPFRPVPPPFPSLKNLFKVNGTHLTWVPLGSLIFNNNGKIIGG